MKNPRTGGRTKVVVATRLFAPEVSAAAFRLKSLSVALAADVDVEVITSVPPTTAPPIDDPSGVEVSRMRALRDSGGNIRGYVQYMSFDVPLAFRLLKRKYDLVVVESPPTTGAIVAVINGLRRRPFVYYAADVWTDGVISMGAPRPVVTVIRTLERFVLRRAASVLSVSDEVTDRLVDLGADRSRVVTIGNGIDTEVFTPEAVPAADDEYFVYTGTMSEWQRPKLFVEALALIADEEPGVKLRFFGQGALQAETKALADELLPGRVEFPGVVPPATAAQWIRGASGALVSIVPGIGYDFARPTKTYAAAACGTPVLFAGAPTGRELVEDAGLGVGADFTAEAVAAAMRELLHERRSGASERLRAQRARWALENVSLSAAGRRAAEASLSVFSEPVARVGSNGE